VAPAGARAHHPAFDVTPAANIAAIVTEAGVLRPPYGEALAAACAAEGPGS
jgi:methylthioribose-1-phosphate isomerase